MPAATSRKDLIAASEKEFSKLETVLEKVAPEAALVPDEDDTSIKDVIAHRAHWIELFLGWYRDGAAGREVALPAPGYKWNELRRYNADLRAAQAGLGWEEAKALLAANHKKLMDFIRAGDDAMLYGAPMAGGGNSWPPGRWAEAAGPSHYRSAANYIRKRLKDLSGPP